MGEFLVRMVDRDSGGELARFAVPNLLAYEGIEHVYRQMFPPYQSGMTFVMGVSGPDTQGPSGRPQPYGGGIVLDAELTWDDVTDALANEGGCYTDGMRDSFGYARRSVTFTARNDADGGGLVSNECTFPNGHSWTPQGKSAWDNPDTPDEIEQPPPEWRQKYQPEPEVGFPWHVPRKLCYDVGGPDPPLSPAYMKQWDASGALDWLCDFRKIGGFPITAAWVGDSSRNKLIAAAWFRRPVLLWPGTTLYITYRARLVSIPGQATASFLTRYAKYAFEKTGSRYSPIYCRPALATAPRPFRRATYDDYVDHFVPAFGPVELGTWTYVPGQPPYIRSNVPEWMNGSGATLGPFGQLVAYGTVGAGNELMWAQPIDPAVLVPSGDVLRVPDGVRFQLDGV
jgi:hypothetical protein